VWQTICNPPIISQAKPERLERPGRHPSLLALILELARQVWGYLLIRNRRTLVYIPSRSSSLLVNKPALALGLLV
jgi:hypothetical protein